MRVNYKELADSYAQSGLTLKAFGEQIGMSSSMVSYYLKKARSEDEQFNPDNFSPIGLTISKSERVIRICASDGLTIEIPI